MRLAGGAGRGTRGKGVETGAPRGGGGGGRNKGSQRRREFASEGKGRRSPAGHIGSKFSCEGQAFEGTRKRGGAKDIPLMRAGGGRRPSNWEGREGDL